MPNRQYATPLLIRGLGPAKAAGEISRLQPIFLQGQDGDRYPAFNERWFQELLYKVPSLLPAEEIEPAFRGLEPIAIELPVAGKSLDLLFMNSAGCIALVETKLVRNPQARREVVAQTIDYACEMSGWSYDQLVAAIKNARQSTQEDPLLELMRNAKPDSPFDENLFRENVTRNLQKGRFLLLVVGDQISPEVERMADFIQRTPHLHFTMGLVEIALFRESEKTIDPLFVQPRVVAKTELHTRVVIDIRLPENVQMSSTIAPETNRKPTTRTTISQEQFLEDLGTVSAQAAELAKWVLENAHKHQLRIDWLTSGPILKYDDDERGVDFNFGQMKKYGALATGHFLLARFKKLGLPTNIALDYLDEIIRLVPGAYRKEVAYDKEIKSEFLYYRDTGDGPPLDLLLPHKEAWFEAIDRAISRIREMSR